MNILAAFNLLSPQVVERADNDCEGNLQLLAKTFPTVDEKALLQELTSFKVEVTQELAFDCDELKLLYPNLGLLSVTALTVSVLSVNCERDFSAMNRIRTNLRNRLQGKSFTVCLHMKINGWG
ncbi:hypothetical protein CHARACLAT_029251 [Characodon lateralis]|uniref:HAT C-terminal dimerisation domain-containing protein n=1 Tax=Characodon lateralis TaxID=208331 RepID=A0ABU7DV83_9TELE|nr:hypothetical protein [Characodon lateralis]